MNAFRPWNEIYNDSSNGATFKAEILELQELSTQRAKSLQWAQNLRFLSPFEQANPDRDPEWEDDEGLTCDLCCDYPYFNSPDSQTPTVTAFRLTEPGELKGCDHYIAVSYCWRQPKNVVPDRPYTVYTKVNADTRESRPNKAPKAIIDRAVAFASFYGIRFIWIDQECIDQDDRLDQEVGIQSMDLVYQRSAAPIGILQTCLESQLQFDILGYLEKDEELEYEQVEEAIQLLELVSHDPWFTRAWILQESTSAGEYMTLLLKLDASLSANIEWNETPGEFELNFPVLLKLVQQVALQIESHHKSGGADIEELLSWVAETIHADGSNIDSTIEKIDAGERLMDRVQKAKDHLIVHSPSDQWTARIPTHRVNCNAALVGMYLAHCFNSRLMDRLAILANMCQYPIRIDTNKTQNSKYSLEACLFTQAILNGDLSLLVGLKKSVWEQLPAKRNGFSWLPPGTTDIEPKDMECWLEGMQMFRLSDHQITKDGLNLLGFVWEIDGKIDVSDLQEKFKPLFENHSHAQKDIWDNALEQLKAFPEYVPPEGPMEQSDMDDPTKVQRLGRWKDALVLEKWSCELLKAIIQKVLAQGFPVLADAIWSAFKSKAIHFTPSEREAITADYNAAVDGPTTLDEWIDEKVDLKILPESSADALLLSDDPMNLMVVRVIHPFSGRDDHETEFINPWLIERVLEKGYFYYGHLSGQGNDRSSVAVFDVDEPMQVLLPFAEGMDKVGSEWDGKLPAFQGKRISWKVKEISMESASRPTGSQHELRNFESHGMVAGMWKLGDTKPQRYNLC